MFVIERNLNGTPLGHRRVTVHDKNLFGISKCKRFDLIYCQIHLTANLKKSSINISKLTFDEVILGSITNESNVHELVLQVIQVDKLWLVHLKIILYKIFK